MEPAILIALVAAVPGTLAAIIQYRNRSMNPKENGVDWVVHRYREMAEEAHAAREEALDAAAEAEAAAASLRVKVASNATAMARLRTVVGARPMLEFVESKFLAVLNATIVNPEGGHIAMYVDDIDGTIALGWQIVPLAELPHDVAAADYGNPRDIATMRAAISDALNQQEDT